MESETINSIIILLIGCSTDYEGEYEFFVLRGFNEIALEDDNGVVFGHSNSSTGNQYVMFESATLTVWTYNPEMPSRRVENHIRVGEYYTVSGISLRVSETQ